MSAQSAIGLAEEWLYSVLSNDSTVTGIVGSQIYSGQAPEGATYPLVVFQLYMSTDAIALGNSLYLTENQYLLRAADRLGSIAQLDALMYRVRQLLHGQVNVTLPNGAMLGCQRLRNLSIPGVVAGAATRELAALYRIVTQEA